LLSSLAEEQTSNDGLQRDLSRMTVIEQAASRRRNARASYSAQVTRRLLRARDFIDAHFSEPISVSTIARAAHQSPAHFARQFRSAFGETPHQYLLSRRLQRASSLLRNTDYTAITICMTVGFQSAGSFTTAFGKVYGMTPIEYRARHLPLLVERVIPPCVREAVDRPQLSGMREAAAGYPR
jgi:AraC-like DNA-binding protein